MSLDIMFLTNDNLRRMRKQPPVLGLRYRVCSSNANVRSIFYESLIFININVDVSCNGCFTNNIFNFVKPVDYLFVLYYLHLFLNDDFFFFFFKFFEASINGTIMLISHLL